MNEVLLKIYLNAAHCSLELAQPARAIKYAKKVQNSSLSKAHCIKKRKTDLLIVRQTQFVLGLDAFVLFVCLFVRLITPFNTKSINNPITEYYLTII